MNKSNPVREKRVTIKDVARIAKVSPSAVSRVINSEQGVSEDTRYRILRIANALNYRPNLVARSLVKQKSDSIAMLITNTRNPIFPEIAQGVEDTLRKRGYSLNIVSTYDDPKIETKEIEALHSKGIDGLIVSSSLIESESLSGLVQSGFPVVAVLRRPYHVQNLDFVIVDNVRGGYLAVEHLIRLGHKQIAVIRGPANTSTGIERFEGALKAFKAYGVHLFNDLIQMGDYSKESGYLATNRFFQMGLKIRQIRPTAIFACNDDMAIGALEALLDMGLRVPEDVALVGFNNVEITSLRTIELTTIRQQKREMGRLAAERLLEKIDRNKSYDEPSQVILEPKLVIRKSCGFRMSSRYVLEEVKAFPFHA